MARNLAAFAILLAMTVVVPAQRKAAVSSEPLTAEEQAVYRAFLGSFSTGGRWTTNLADRTVLFQPDASDQKGCLKGLALQASADVHAVAVGVLPANGYRLVDPRRQRQLVAGNDPGVLIRQGVPVRQAVSRGFAAGVLTLSEIAFSPGHRYAVFQYSFYCGSLCGGGAVLIYERSGGSWKRAAASDTCGHWEA